MNSLTKNIFILFFIGLTVFLFGNLLYGGFQFDSLNDFLIEFGFYQLYSFVIGISNMAFFNYLNNREWDTNESIKRLIIGALGSVVISLTALFFLRMFTSVVYFGGSYKDFIASESYQNYSFGLWITLTIVIVFHAIYYFKKNQENKVKESQIVAKNQTAKFESLKNQLDPHFSIQL
jgi:hypothetical protein